MKNQNASTVAGLVHIDSLESFQLENDHGRLSRWINSERELREVLDWANMSYQKSQDQSTSSGSVNHTIPKRIPVVVRRSEVTQALASSVDSTLREIQEVAWELGTFEETVQSEHLDPQKRKLLREQSLRYREVLRLCQAVRRTVAELVD